MAKYFIDSWFIIALLDERNKLEIAAAEQISDDIFDGQHEIYVTEMVLSESLSGFALSKNSRFRNIAVEFVEALRQIAFVKVIPQTHEQFESAFTRYKRYADKEWSMVDCASMEAMQENGISVAITNDHHFEQAQFVRRFTG